MNTRWTPLRAGIARGWIDLKHALTNWEDLAGFLIPSTIGMIVMFFLQGVDIPGAPTSLGSMSLPSMMGLNIVFSGLLGIMQTIVEDRENGTLLRAKTIPGGMTGYFVGAVIRISSLVVAGALIVLVFGLFLFDGLSFDTPAAWVTLLAVLAVGLVATMPLGAALGSLFTSPRMLAFIMFPVMGLVAISGIFYPITSMPTWVQGLAQVFPIYWLGLGMRSALLPDGNAHVEIGESWRHLETFGVLGVWAVLGIVLAPILLRRMARRESGSAVAERRERAMQRPR